jgi:hypothetical protein
MADQAIAAVDYLALGFLLLGSRHNEVAMSRRHERRPGGPIKYSRYISLWSSLPSGPRRSLIPLASLLPDCFFPATTTTTTTKEVNSVQGFYMVTV